MKRRASRPYRRDAARITAFSPGRAVLAALAFAIGLAPPASGETLGSTYEALREAALDGRRATVDGVTIERDAFRLELAGSVHFLAPVAGATPGAVFVGNGKLTLAPASPVERYHLAVRTGAQGPLEERFDQALFLFSDPTDADALGLASAHAGSPDPAAVDLAREWVAHAEAEGFDLALRLLRQRSNDEGHDRGAWFVLIEGEALGRAIAADDPAGMLGAEPACLLVIGGDDPGYWYSGGPVAPAIADPDHYAIQISVSRGTELNAEAEVTLEVRAPGVRTIPFDLLPALEVRAAHRIGDDPLSPDGAAAIEVVHGIGGSALLLPTAVAAGETLRARIRYGGEGVIEDDGADVYIVKARSNWYPRFGSFRARAIYELAFRVPKDLMVVAVGREAESRIEEGRRMSVWRTEHPIVVAGFNYGDFEVFEQTEENTGSAFAAYASKGTPDIIAEINMWLEQYTSTGGTDPRVLAEVAIGGSTTYVDTYSGPSSVDVSTEAMAETALADAVNAVQVFTAYFGPALDDRLAITQQSQWNFGQAWPSLIFLPYWTGLSKVLQVELGLDGYAGFYDEVGIHEVAHQWWAHTVGWGSYRDQWLSEGFAEFSTALVVELTKGAEAHRAFWDRRRASVLRDRKGGSPPYLAGALTLGWRANTEAFPRAYQSLAYSKGAYILHMLRMVMRDFRSADPDARFVAMMKDFVATYRGRSATTEDFKRTVEKHIVPELDATRDGKLDWFFDQWVYGAEVPIYEIDVRAEKAGKGKYRLAGTVAQKGVSEGFLTLVGLYVDLGKGQIMPFGRMPFRGSMSRDLDVTVELPKKPKRVLINADHEVLAFDG